MFLALLVGCSGHVIAQKGEYGKASYYADRFQGRKTASGEIYHKDSLTAAHQTIPFESRIRVTNIENNQSVIVKVIDRGPHVEGRIIDLSRKAMEMLDGIDEGLIDVTLEIVGIMPEDGH